jgi:hypothetical protein
MNVLHGLLSTSRQEEMAQHIAIDRNKLHLLTYSHFTIILPDKWHDDFHTYKSTLQNQDSSAAIVTKLWAEQLRNHS